MSPLYSLKQDSISQLSIRYTCCVDFIFYCINNTKQIACIYFACFHIAVKPIPTDNKGLVRYTSTPFILYLLIL